MEEVVQVEIPEEWLRGLNWNRDAVIKEIVQLGVYQMSGQ